MEASRAISSREIQGLIVWTTDVCDIPQEFSQTNLVIPGWDYDSVITELLNYYEPDNILDDRMITNPITLVQTDNTDGATEPNYKLWEIIPDPWCQIRDTITQACGMFMGMKLKCESLTTSIMSPGDFTIPHYHSGTIHALWYLSDTHLDDLVFYSIMDREFVPVSQVKIKPNDLVVFSGNIAHGTEDLIHDRLVIALTFKKSA